MRCSREIGVPVTRQEYKIQGTSPSGKLCRLIYYYQRVRQLLACLISDFSVRNGSISVPFKHDYMHLVNCLYFNSIFEYISFSLELSAPQQCHYTVRLTFAHKAENRI
jgi:hypothetical protein